MVVTIPDRAITQYRNTQNTRIDHALHILLPTEYWAAGAALRLSSQESSHYFLVTDHSSTWKGFVFPGNDL